eukprot:m.17374 g.17374  ORF g.17374 m.17374 type:complete len:704 (+) comp3495_c0_seq1:488-2599(+)
MPLRARANAGADYEASSDNSSMMDAGTSSRPSSTPLPRRSRYRPRPGSSLGSVAAADPIPPKNPDAGEGVDDFHIKWFSGILQGLDPQLAEGFKGAIEEAADELGLHAEPGETAQQLMFRVVTCSKPTGAASRRHLRAPDSGKIDAELINLILPACISISVEDGEMLIDPEMLVGFLGPSILSGFRTFGWVEMITLPVIFAVIVVLVIERDSTCRMLENRNDNIEPVALRTFFIAKAVTAMATWVANAVMSRKAGEMYDDCIRPQVETVELLHKKEEEIRMRSAGKKSKLLSLLDKRTMIDAALEAGLRMIVMRDDLLTSWIYRTYQFCFIPDMAMDIFMLYLLSRFVAVEQSQCTYEGNKNTLNMLMALALWSAVTLAFRLAIVSTWLARMMFFADKAGLYHWGFMWCKEKDKQLFFGSEVASKTYASLYSKNRRERIQAKLDPLASRTHEALLKLSIFQLAAERRRHRRRIADIEEKLEEFTGRYNDIYEPTGKSFILNQHGHYEHRISHDQMELAERRWANKLRESSTRKPNVSPYGYKMIQTQQGRRAPRPPPLIEMSDMSLPAVEEDPDKADPRAESAQTASSGHSGNSLNSPVTELTDDASLSSPFERRLVRSMKRNLAEKMKEGSGVSYVDEAGDTHLHMESALSHSSSSYGHTGLAQRQASDDTFFDAVASEDAGDETTPTPMDPTSSSPRVSKV